MRYLLVLIMIRVEDFYFYNMHDVCACVCLLWNIIEIERMGDGHGQFYSSAGKL